MPYALGRSGLEQAPPCLWVPNLTVDIRSCWKLFGPPISKLMKLPDPYELDGAPGISPRWSEIDGCVNDEVPSRQITIVADDSSHKLRDTLVLNNRCRLLHVQRNTRTCLIHHERKFAPVATLDSMQMLNVSFRCMQGKITNRSTATGTLRCIRH